MICHLLCLDPSKRNVSEDNPIAEGFILLGFSFEGQTNVTGAAKCGNSKEKQRGGQYQKPKVTLVASKWQAAPGMAIRLVDFSPLGGYSLFEW
jgi:hypothetical protein